MRGSILPQLMDQSLTPALISPRLTLAPVSLGAYRVSTQTQLPRRSSRYRVPAALRDASVQSPARHRRDWCCTEHDGQ
ncbi:hypothetical protein TNCT1_67710 [Streptomyces sp. 1-11]|nr:hypothetical protein TNCT1_67710 [Streptomyces sp. 1-11]